MLNECSFQNSLDTHTLMSLLFGRAHTLSPAGSRPDIFAKP